MWSEATAANVVKRMDVHKPLEHSSLVPALLTSWHPLSKLNSANNSMKKRR